MTSTPHPPDDTRDRITVYRLWRPAGDDHPRMVVAGVFTTEAMAKAARDTVPNDAIRRWVLERIRLRDLRPE